MVVGPITDDVRLFEVPQLRVVALRFTERARARILQVRLVQHVSQIRLLSSSSQAVCGLHVTSDLAYFMTGWR